MLNYELPPEVQHWVYLILVWVGFGTVAGLAAMILLPVRRPSHPVATLLLGIVGSVLGLAGLQWALQGKEFNPIGPVGFAAAVVGSFVLLLLFRLYQAILPKPKVEEEEEEEE